MSCGRVCIAGNFFLIWTRCFQTLCQAVSGVLIDLPHQALEGQLADQQLGGLLVATDPSESHGTGLVTVVILHSASGWSALAVLVVSYFLGAFTLVDLQAVCLVLAIVFYQNPTSQL